MTDYLFDTFLTDDDAFYYSAIEGDGTVLIRMTVEKIVPHESESTGWEWLVWADLQIAPNIDFRRGIAPTLEAAKLSAMRMTVQVLWDIAGETDGCGPANANPGRTFDRLHARRMTRRGKIQARCGGSRNRVQGRELTCLNHSPQV